MAAVGPSRWGVPLLRFMEEVVGRHHNPVPVISTGIRRLSRRLADSILAEAVEEREMDMWELGIGEWAV